MTTVPTFTYRCPRCDQRLSSPTSKCGRATRCPACDRPLIIPLPDDLPETVNNGRPMSDTNPDGHAPLPPA